MSTPPAAAMENGNEDQNSENTRQKNDKEFLLVVVTFIATVAFQAGINPPGGVWQEAKDSNVGKSIMAIKQPYRFNIYITSPTTCMLLSLVQFLVLLSGLHNNRLSVSRNFLIISCSFAIGAMASAYWTAVTALTPEPMLHTVANTLIISTVLAAVLIPILVYIDRRNKCAHC